MLCRTIIACIALMLALGVQVLTAQSRKQTRGAPSSGNTIGHFPALETAPTDILPFSSRYTIDVWNSENGLPANAVLAMCQTRDGYIWIGTYSGLARFDGVRFTVYGKKGTTLKEMGKESGVSAIQVYSLYEDRSGTLWVGLSEGGIVRVRGEESVFLNEKDGLPNSKVWSFCELPDKTLLAGTDKGIFRFEPKSQSKNQPTFVRDSAANTEIQGTEVYLLGRSDGSLWIGTSEGLYQKSGGKTIKHNFNRTFSNKIYCLREDRLGNIWAGTSSAAYCWDGKTMSADTTLPNLESFLHDSKGNVWIGLSDKLICRKNITSDTLTKRDGLADDRIYSLMEDIEGNIWVGTYYGGLQRLKHGKFLTLTAREGLQGDVVYNIRQSASNHALWISYIGGARRMQDGEIKTITSLNGLRNTAVRDVLEETNGTTWIATYGGLYKLVGNSLTLFTAKNGLSSDRIRILRQTDDGTILIGTNNGLNMLRNGIFTTYKRPNGAPMPGLLTMFVDSKQQIWIGTDGEGIMTIRGDTLLEYRKEQGLLSNVVFCFHEDNNGDIWAGTKEGLTRISTSAITTFTSADGLADNQIFQLVEDEFGFFWIGCNKGIMRVQREELLQRARGKSDKVACALYNRSDGTSSNRTNAPAAACRTSDGRIWFPTDRGVTIVEPRNFRLNSSVPSVFVPQIFVDGAGIVLGSGNNSFEANVQRLEFHYTALSFFAPEKVLFKYRLEGYDNEWIDAGTRRVAYYTSLPRGRDYRFRVIACNNDGIWNEQGATIAFYLKPYWYETSWFYAACVLIILGGAFGLYRRRVHAIETRAMALEETVRLRTAELQAANAEISRRMEIQSEQAHQIESANKDLLTTNIQLDEANRLKTQLLSMAAHDLKNPLSAIIGLSELALTGISKEHQTWELLGHIHTTAERMGLLIKDLLDAATIELGNIALHPSNVALPLLAHSVADRYRLNAEQKNQLIKVETEKDIIVSADAARLEQVFDNLISNAVKYSPPDKTIYVRVKKTGLNARIEVQDEGPGISAEDQKKLFGFFQRLSARPTGGESSNGVGLAIVRKIVNLHGGTIWVHSELGKGTTFIMELPLV